MNHDQETYELIEHYLRGELEGEDLLRFEQQMEADADLKEEVTLQNSVDSLLADEEINQLDDQLAALRSDYAQAPRQRSMRMVWFAAAAVLILIATYVGLFRGSDGTSNADLYMTYFELYPADNSVRSGDSIQTQLTLALDAYESEEFEKAVETLQPLIQNNTRALFYYNLSQMALGKTAEAAILLQSIDDNSIYAGPADWYTALALLKEDKPDIAIKLLETLKLNAQGKYQSLAAELLEKLQ